MLILINLALLWQIERAWKVIPLSDINQNIVNVNNIPTIIPSPSPTPFIIKNTNKDLLLDVPFTPQAPFWEWKDPRHQDACEEAAALMAVKWARKEDLTYEDAKKIILDIVDYQEENYGEYRDTGAEDTADRIIKEYFDYQKVVVKTVNNPGEIVKELQSNNVVIIPLNGQVINNPGFTQPGPERHMVVIRGYDSESQEFITNDPGIMNGKLYLYPKEVLFNGIRDYSTGYHIPITEVVKTMIIVSQP